MISMDSADTSCTPGASPITDLMSRTCLMYCPCNPQISASASPRRTASAPMTVVLVRTMVRAVSGVTPLRPTSEWNSETYSR